MSISPRSTALAKKKLKAAYRQFMHERESRAYNESGKELIRVIFGEDAIDEDTLPQTACGFLGELG
jgi:hypothetical protein